MSCKLLETPPVGESMHESGQCHCHLCTCGEHICPKPSAKPLYSPSSLKSIYQREFYKKVVLNKQLSLPICKNSPVQSPVYRSELISTSHYEFGPVALQKTKSDLPVKPRKKASQGISKITNYSNDFPNWGNFGYIRVGHTKSPFTKNDVKLVQNTTYKDNFSHKPISRNKSLVIKNSKNPIIGGTEFLGKATSEKLLPHSPANFPKIIKVEELPIPKLSSPKIIYKTAYKISFTPQEVSLFSKKKDINF